MQETRHITITSGRRKIVLNIDSILYVLVVGRNIEIHIFDGTVYETWMKMTELEETLGSGFLKIHRGCLVAARAIHSITDKIELSSGESLIYTLRKKKQLVEELRAKQEEIIRSFSSDGTPRTAEEYRSHYGCFDALPVAFTDIELVFDTEKRAVDWIFRYANPALAAIEKLPLEKLLNNSFASLFANMDPKWLRAYERVALYGETVEVIDYSPEIDTYLKIICFPTFPGHCGCVLFDVTKIRFAHNGDAQKAWMLYLSQS